MRRVVLSLCRELDPKPLVERLEEKSKENGQDFKFVDLVDVLSKEDKEWAFSTEMGNNIGVEKIGTPYAVIWAPSPIDENWFAKLASERYQGRMILVYGWVVNSEEFLRHAHCSFKIPQVNLADRIYEALRE